MTDRLTDIHLFFNYFFFFSVCPGVIDTPMTRPHMDTYKPAIAIAPMNRPGTAQEIADTVLFLCSSKATFCQGMALICDGGYVQN